MGESDQYKIDVRLLRLRVGLTLCQVSDAIGVSGASISLWENGMLDLKFKVEQTAKILKLYNVSIEELVEAWQKTERHPYPGGGKKKVKEVLQTNQNH